MVPQILYHKDAPMLCGEATLVKIDGRTGSAVTLFCKRWTCDECAPNLRRRVRALIMQGEPSTFITLTASDQAGHTPAQAARTLVIGWRRLCRRILVKRGMDRLPFFAVLEETKRGRPHLHILCRVGWLRQSWLSAQWQELAQSKIVDIRSVKSQRHAARYLAKYLAKGPTRFEGCKRYWRSLDWLLDLTPRDREIAHPDSSYHADLYRGSSMPSKWPDIRSFRGAVGSTSPTPGPEPHPSK